MSFLVTGNVLTEWTRLTGNTATTLFTAKKKTTIVSMSFKERAGGTPTLSVVRHDNANNVDYSFRNAEAVTVNQLVTIDLIFTLNNGDTIKATSGDAAGNFDCFIDYLAPDLSVQGDHS